MTNAPFNNIIAAIQTATSPVILISGVGLLLLTMTNRLGRAIDRARALSSSGPEHTPEARAQIEVLMVRARLLRSAILCAVGGALCAGVLVIFIFLMLLSGRDLSVAISACFIVCIGFIIVSLVYFIRDVNLSLHALHAKLER